MRFDFVQFFHFYCSLSLLKWIFIGFNDIADPNALMPSLCLVNKASLDRILQSEVYVNELNGQLRAAHLILGYTPISRAFQAPKCVIRAKDPRLHRISIAYEGFVVPKGIPLPRYSPLTQPLPIATLAAGATSSPPFFKQRRKRKQNKRKRALWTSLSLQMTTKFSINLHLQKTCQKRWVSKRSPKEAFRSY